MKQSNTNKKEYWEVTPLNERSETAMLLAEVLEQLKTMNNTLEEIHEELHEITNRSGY